MPELPLFAAFRRVNRDDTNLPDRTVQLLTGVAAAAGARVEVWDMRGVPAEVCIARDAARARPVAEQVVRGMHDRYKAED